MVCIGFTKIFHRACVANPTELVVIFFYTIPFNTCTLICIFDPFLLLVPAGKIPVLRVNWACSVVCLVEIYSYIFTHDLAWTCRPLFSVFICGGGHTRLIYYIMFMQSNTHNASSSTEVIQVR